MIDWNALHEACVAKISFFKKEIRIAKRTGTYWAIPMLVKLIRRYEALLEFIDTRIQTSINQPV